MKVFQKADVRYLTNSAGRLMLRLKENTGGEYAEDYDTGSVKKEG